MSARAVAWSAPLVMSIGAALGQQLPDPVEGERLAISTCAGCHGGVDAQGGAPAFVTIAAEPSSTEDSLLSFLDTPHASMPNLILSRADRHNLVAYILSLRP
jgi:mono/diheme cytochrome c family protein